MSGPKAVPTFVRAEEGKGTMTIHYRTDEGTDGSMTFGLDDDSEFQIVRVVHLGRRSAPDQEIQVYLQQRGQPEPDHGWGTHLFGVKLPYPDVHVLGWQLYDFMVLTENLVERLSHNRAKLNSISYGDDHIAVKYDDYRTLKLGLVSDRYRFTLDYYAVDFGEGIGPVGMTFGFIDEDGVKRRIGFSASAEDIWSMKLELDAFTKAFEAAHSPKLEAAAISYTLQQAA
jgi:hypothetical protein